MKTVLAVALLAASTTAASAAALPEQSAAKAAELKSELPRRYKVSVQNDAFVVVSDGPMKLHRKGLRVIRRGYKALYKEFFTVHPDRPIVTYLFKDVFTYRRHCKKKYGEKPDTPFGFYDDKTRELIMNFGSGPGTLAHELVHPLIEHDFPKVPAWFNEGFAALMEHKYYTKGEGLMRAFVNWRMKGLKAAVKAGRRVSLRELMTSSTNAFYDDAGWTYALARHFLLFLQRQELLPRYYKAFRAGVEADPTGIKSLAQITGESLAQTEARFKKWLRRYVR